MADHRARDIETRQHVADEIGDVALRPQGESAVPEGALGIRDRPAVDGLQVRQHLDVRPFPPRHRARAVARRERIAEQPFGPRLQLDGHGREHLLERRERQDDAGVDQMVPVPIEAFDLLPRGVVQGLDARLPARRETGVQEDGVVDHGGDRLAPQPAAVVPARPHRLHVFDEPGRMRVHPFVSRQRFRGRKALAVFPPPRFVRPVLPPGVFAPPLGVLRREGGEDFGRDVPDVGHQVHRLVVAQQHPDFAARLPRAVLEPHQQVHDLAHLGAPVGEVAGLHQRRVSPAPAVLVVDQAGLPQDRAQPVAGAVDVADGDHAAGGGPVLDGGGGDRAGGGDCAAGACGDRAAGGEQRNERGGAGSGAETSAAVRGERDRGRREGDGVHDDPHSIEPPAGNARRAGAQGLRRPRGIRRRQWCCRPANRRLTAPLGVRPTSKSAPLATAQTAGPGPRSARRCVRCARRSAAAAGRAAASRWNARRR